MPLAEFLNDPKSATPVQDHSRPLDPAVKLRKQVFLQFVAIALVGLALIGWYVGFRIYSGPRAPRPVIPVAKNPVPPPLTVLRPEPKVPTAPPPVEHKPVEIAPRQPSFTRRDATPRPGEKYLQIAAFGPRALDRYLRTLESRGLNPVVAPSPVDNIYRILIGPLRDSVALEETRRLIQASGIEPILRSY